MSNNNNKNNSESTQGNVTLDDRFSLSFLGLGALTLADLFPPAPGGDGAPPPRPVQNPTYVYTTESPSCEEFFHLF